MTTKQQEKITELMKKYNDILLHSMRLAIVEDFVNLIILNKDDSDFGLQDVIQNKEQCYQFIMKEFLRLNSSSVTAELRKMDNTILPKLNRMNSKQKSRSNEKSSSRKRKS